MSETQMEEEKLEFLMAKTRVNDKANPIDIFAT
jgi:hypothetical protein